jgi:hypothetical protein
LGWRIDYFDLTLLSVRNLSNIAHTRACIALNQCSEPVEKRANLQSAPRQMLSLLLRGAADSRAKRPLAKVCGAAASQLSLLGATL